jgi:hypothetical protein
MADSSTQPQMPDYSALDRWSRTLLYNLGETTGRQSRRDVPSLLGMSEEEYASRNPAYLPPPLVKERVRRKLAMYAPHVPNLEGVYRLAQFYNEKFKRNDPLTSDLPAWEEVDPNSANQ